MSLDCQTQAVDQLPSPLLPSRAQWPFYAVRTKSNREFVTHASFLGKGFESYLPTYKRNKSGHSTTRTVELPLFPGYVFCRFDVHRRQPILVTPGVFQIVSFNGLPAPLTKTKLPPSKR